MLSYNNSLYHITSVDHPIYIVPKVPEVVSVNKNIENNKIKRVCLSTCIEGCLRAVEYKLRTVYVHTPEDIRDLDIVSNEIINNNEYVYDSLLTKETWSLSPFKTKIVAKLFVIDFTTTKKVCFKNINYYVASNWIYKILKY
jgi:hypothetical protein